MKRVIVLLLVLFLPVAAAAQNFQNMSEQDMQKMMEAAQKMQVCMEQVDQEQLKVLEQESKKFDAELKALCSAGKRDEAQKKAISYGKKMMNDPTLKQMKKCGEMAMGMMPPQMGLTEEDFDYSDRHVCDE